MSEHRARMMAAFKSRFVPALRARGFTGAFPYFRRRSPQRLDLLMVQFNKYGGSFAVTLGRAGPDGLVAGPWKDLPPDRLNPTHLDRERRALTPAEVASPGDHWFPFGPDNTEDPRPAEPQAHYDAVADAAIAALDKVGERWFDRPEPPETGGEPSGPPPRAPLVARLFGFR